MTCSIKYCLHVLAVDADDEELLTKDEETAIQYTATMDTKMKSMIREVVFYVFLLMLLLIVINGQQDTKSFQQNTNIAAMFTSGLDDQVCL